MVKIVFYDGSCPLCNWIVRFLIKADTKDLFLFAPLQGETAKKRLNNPSLQHVVLLEGDRQYYASKAVLRLFWLLGGRYRLIGWAYILPAFLTDPLYYLVAKNRNRLFPNKKSVKIDSSKILP